MKLTQLSEEDRRDLMQTLASAISAISREVGVDDLMFTILVWNDQKDVMYASNCRREDVARAMREGAGKIENNEDRVRADPHGQAKD